MSDLEGASTPAAANISAFAAGKLRAIGGGDGFRGTGEVLVDAFADIFARMAAGSPTSSRTDSWERESWRSDTTDRSEPQESRPSETSMTSGHDSMQGDSLSQDIQDRGSHDGDAIANAVGPVKQVSNVVELTKQSDVVLIPENAKSASTENEGQRRSLDHRSISDTPWRSEATAEAVGRETSADAFDSRNAENPETTQQSEFELEDATDPRGVDARDTSKRSSRQSAVESGVSIAESKQQQVAQKNQTPASVEIAAQAMEHVEVTSLEASQSKVSDTLQSPISNSTAVAVVNATTASNGSSVRPNSGELGGIGELGENPLAATAPASGKGDATSAKSGKSADMVSRIKLIQRVTKAFQYLGPSGGVVRLRLAPAELGSIQVEMRINHRKVQARIVAETETATVALREHLPELRTRLESYGMQIEKLDVETGGDAQQQEMDFQDESQRQTRQQSRQAQRPNQAVTPQSPESGEVSQSVSHAASLAQGIDVRL